MTITLSTARNTQWALDRIVAGLRDSRERWRVAQHRSSEVRGREFPSRDALADILQSLRGALFPMRLGPVDLHQEGEDFYVGYTLDTALNALLHQVRLELGYTNRHANVASTEQETQAVSIVRKFAHSLPRVRDLLDSDVEAAYHGDPAAR